MPTVIEYASYIIDLSMAMLERSDVLNDAQEQRLTMIHRRAIDFLTDYMQHESSPLPKLLEFLGHDAQSPVRIIVGCSEMLLSGQCGAMQEAYLEAIGEIQDCAQSIYDEILDMYSNLNEFMSNLDMAE